MNMKRAALAVSTVAASPFVLVLAIAFAGGATLTTTASASAATAYQCGTATAGVGADIGDGEKLTSEQIGNAEIIYQVGIGLGVPAYGEEIAIATAVQESRLINRTTATNYDSLGLFQQRPSQGWGTPAELTDPVYASTKFYQALEKVSGWQQLPLSTAAQDVQRSADPAAYARWQTIAGDLVTTFAGSAGSCITSDGNGQITTSGGKNLPSGYAIPSGTPAAVVTAINYAVAQLGKPYIWGGVGPTGYDCSGLVMEAYLAAGIQLPRTSQEQVLVGTPIYSDADLKAGDLLFSAGSDGTPTSPGHVAIYIGDGYVIEAPHTGADVEISTFATAWKSQLVAIRRIVG
jgi:cell wall-associated NlpC family hydrolase